MLRALTYLDAIDTDRHFKEVRARLEPYGWATLDDQVLVNVLKAQLDFDVYASDVRGVHEKLKADSEPLNKLAGVLEEAVGFLNDIGVRGPGALPYTYQLVTLAALAAQLPGGLRKPEVQSRLRDWFWITTYTEVFSGTTGSRIRDGIRQLVDTLKNGAPPVEEDFAPVKRITQIRMSTGRTSAFLLFLAGLPNDEKARESRQELLGTGDPRVISNIFASTPSGIPGNRVIATPAELRALRAALKQRQIDPEMADKYGLPPADILGNQWDQEKFLHIRNVLLISQERIFIETFGLKMSHSE
jgi:hypothetical protein